MRALALFSVLLCGAVLGQVEMGTPYTVGNAGYGYRLALPDGQGNVILASNPVGEFQTIVTKSEIGAAGTPSGENSGQIALLATKGHVNAGCLNTQGDSTFLYAAMSASGWVAKIDVSFPSEAVSYLNATDPALLWAHASPQQFVSVVCMGRYVYFGTKSASVSNTIARLDTHDSNPSTRFAVLGAIAPGDFTHGIAWGTDVLFAMEADDETPLTFYTVNGGSGFALKAVTPAEGVEGYAVLGGLVGDFSQKRVIVPNGSGSPRVGMFDLSLASHAVLHHEVELNTEGLSPITSFVADMDSNYGYVTVGDCATDAGTAMVSVRLAPALAQSTFAVSPNTFNCTAVGTPALGFLVKQEGDTQTAPAPRRQVVIATQLERGDEADLKPGVLIPYAVYAAGPCSADCNSPNGECAGEQCHCTVAFTGATCSNPAPCGGTDCSSQGDCQGDGSCVCHIGYSGADCSSLVPCPLSCSGRGSCNASRCVCEEGFSGLACELENTGCESLNNCNGHGSCVHGHPLGSCECDSGFTGVDCATVDLSCPSNCSGHGECNQGSCVCDEQWSGEDCATLVPSCPANCSARGDCDHGRCSCFPGFHGDDCGTVDAASCLHGCSGHGSCVRGLCECASGFSGVDCSTVDSALQPAEEVIMVAGENKATTSFVVSVTADEVVFCMASTPGKCVAFDPSTMNRVRDASFEEAESLLVQTHKADKTKSALVPETLAMVELGASIGSAPISVAVVEDTPNGFAILGTKANEGTMHGQLIKISTSTLTSLAELEFDDDTGRGVTAGTHGPTGTFFFASGNDPGMIYQVNEQLEIIARVAPEQAPAGAVSSLLYDGSRFLLAASGNTVHVYEVSGATIVPPVGVAPVVLPDAFGIIMSGFVETVDSKAVAHFGTSSSPAAIVKVTVNATAATTESIRLRSGENRATSVVRKGDTAYWGLGSDSGKCTVAKMSVSAFREMEATQLEHCAADLTSASISTDNDFVYFGNEASPAHIYSVRLFQRSSCPRNCTGRGFCLQGTCSCDLGFGGDDCSVADPICANNCSQAGTCDHNGTCHCNPGHFGYDCSVIEICADKCQNGRCAGINNNWPCECESAAWAGTYCSERTNYCPRECSNHGSCNDGTCVCDQGYHGDDCSRETFPPVTQRGCAADADCGSHGVCDLNRGSGTGTCKCAAGWTGEDCDIDRAFRDALETSKVSTGMLVVLGLLAACVGLVGGIAIYKSYLGGAAAGSGSGAPVARASHVGGGSKEPSSTGYTRFPHPGHRLVK